MKRALYGLVILLAFFAFTGALFWAIMAGGGDTPAYAARRVVAQVQPTPTKAVVALLYDDGSWATVTPPRSATPTPTATASPTSTATPTATSTSTLPPDDTATPTQETTPPPPTFTFTPQPSKLCSLRSGHPAGLPINIRSGPGTTYSIIGNWPVGTESVFDSFQLDATYLWAHHQAGGWNVVALVNPWVWWATGTADSEACREVDGWPGTDPPAPIAAVVDGPHVIIGEGGSVHLQYCQNISAGKYTQGVMQYATLLKGCNPDAWTVCRVFDDDIGFDTNYNAQETYNRLKNAFSRDCDAIEIENEKTPRNTAEWEGWSDYYIRLAQLFGADGYQILAFGFGPGWPAFDELQYIVAYLRWVADNPLPDGRYHGVSSHASLYAPWSRGDMPWVNNDYLAGRVYLMRDWIYTITPDDFDLAAWPGIWAITEAGLSDGYSGGAWGVPYSCEELASAWHYTIDVYKEKGYPKAAFQWNHGHTYPWTSDHACSAALWG